VRQRLSGARLASNVAAGRSPGDGVVTFDSFETLLSVTLRDGGGRLEHVVEHRRVSRPVFVL
jgi:hypothetical protein